MAELKIVRDPALEEVQGLRTSDPEQRIKHAHQLISVHGSISGIYDFFMDDDHSSPTSCSVLRQLIEQLAQPEFKTLYGDSTPVKRIMDSILKATTPSHDRLEDIPLEEVTEFAPKRWPTGCYAVDGQCGGGGYGLTALCGSPKVGKSYLAISSAIEAAKQGWTVVYLNAELTPNEIMHRITNYAGGSFDDAILENLRVVGVLKGIRIKDVYERIRSAVTMDTTKLLVVADSLNRIVNLSSQGNPNENYWDLFGSWVDFARLSVQFSEGDISFLLVSELNKDGTDKGRHLGHAANMMIGIASSEEIGHVSIDVSLNRSGAQVEPVLHERDWKRGRFVFEDVE